MTGSVSHSSFNSCSSPESTYFHFGCSDFVLNSTSVPSPVSRVAFAADGPLEAASEDQVANALTKIASFISVPKKFHKASGLLRQLLKNDQIQEQQGRFLFEVRASAASLPQRTLRDTHKLSLALPSRLKQQRYLSVTDKRFSNDKALCAKRAPCVHCQKSLCSPGLKPLPASCTGTESLNATSRASKRTRLCQGVFSTLYSCQQASLGKSACRLFCGLPRPCTGHLPERCLG